MGVRVIVCSRVIEFVPERITEFVTGSDNESLIVIVAELEGRKVPEGEGEVLLDASTEKDAVRVTSS